VLAARFHYAIPFSDHLVDPVTVSDNWNHHRRNFQHDSGNLYAAIPVGEGYLDLIEL